MKNLKSFIAALFAGMILLGCGVSEEKINNVKQRIDTLQTKGVPDSVISDAKRCMFMVRNAMESGQVSSIGKKADSMEIYTEQAESWYKEQMERLKKEVPELKSSISEKKEELSGLHKEYADSIISIADSLMEIDWYLQAENELTYLDSIFPRLIEDQETADEIRPKVTGTWVFTESGTGEQGISYNEKKTYTLKSNGEVESVEWKKGQTGPDLKEDWRFESSGEWELMGDTVKMEMQKEVCSKQNYQYKKDGKWEMDKKPTYDSTFTDPKTTTLLYEELKSNWRKK